MRDFEPTFGESPEETALRLRIHNDGIRARRERLYLAIATGLILALTAALALGCSGVPASTYCYTAASATVHAVDTGMSVAGDLYRQGKLTDAQKVKLVAAHDVYRPAAKAVVDGCRALGANDQGKADEAIARIQAAGAHVIEALTAAGVR